MSDELKCLDDHGDGECKGKVQYRMALSGTGIPYPRCDKHWSKRLDKQQAIRRRYPRSAPRDFDPMYAGERWDDDY